MAAKHSKRLKLLGNKIINNATEPAKDPKRVAAGKKGAQFEKKKHSSCVISSLRKRSTAK